MKFWVVSGILPDLADFDRRVLSNALFARCGFGV